MIIDIVGDIDDYAFERYAQNILSQEIGDEIRIRINSLGGYVDVAQDMAEAIEILAEENNVPIVTENTGDVASAATLIYMLGDKRIWNEDKGVFVIHNPWTMNVGDAKSMYDCGRSLEDIQSFFVAIYGARTELSEQEIQSLMDENRPMTTEEIEKYHFITEINQSK